MNREQGLALLESARIVAIVRGVKEEHILGVAEALLDGGIPVLEVTLNTEGALGMISRLQETFGDRMYIGAGTVLDVEDARAAIEAGASYLVTPNTDENVIRYAAARDIPIFPGAMTPTEVVRAWKNGASAIKIFPGASLGIGYIKELMGPFSHIPMMAVGGVTEENIGEFIKLGCYGVGIGGSLINLKEIEAGNYGWVRDKAARLAAGVRGAETR
ncbi:bifunctional 4-hydroxy-2-oxoglutarate aldolase/2-dehydro-3-deoxy-phosphogluconate aldolase [Paenibacillus mucilaginosus]|uniref:2-dehydro-3-deoxyphosphogluconate aldolase n=1 Tax=Paenibacillus mucilaginosus (strain KNP414) TaxID=1036673 RepID=F8FMK9_PAEMK|nr:bifunctional 4-hydroxy-2-oxoglutarate aldolase/2-dehydro-3-deoxy-phosphogluconate aldolase [Paenibacillus mucilaginosus]AEI40092.1 2-dehydro-3-deoxyphosphogluconate aldolase [Paenibacillus mucilaginosus KNP414]MCG7215698.1 bifunctional 4-hydroxy-2-oxoglutarate aldolase/2-dehydro-3-deoxy-phosphogluconate aldolase [Paenibacillus mucilaginosus]WDM29330.1 bifunctional 4-hydroxy-2-oxoglutarate aldolase/2-dehydro-3-deoxy-phosphogluconate aldolase [Paenibacillus mucilaginosus]